MRRSFWETNAESWAHAIRNHLIDSRKITDPAIVSEILARNPKELLDLGCGEGWIGVALSAHPIDYTGVDLSSSLIQKARAVLPQACFQCQSFDDLIASHWHDEEGFDLVVFNFSLFDEDIRPILRWAGSRLNSAGTLIIQTLHPCFTLEPYRDGLRTEDFASFPVSFNGKMNWFGRTLGSWITCLSQAGLRIESIQEPLDSNDVRPVSLILSARLMA